MNAELVPGMRALVLGLGRFGGGREAVRFLHRRGLRVRIADKSAGDDLQDSRRALADLDNLDWQLGREDDDLLDDINLLVVNPAVPDSHSLLRAARERGVPCSQEVNLFLEHYPGRVVAVTGTNGKSSTSTLLHASLLRSGVPALLGGNIGNSLLADEAQWRSDQVAVLEISSFQLERVDLTRHAVHGAVFTRVLEDHVDRHQTLAAYHAAKGRLAALARNFLVHAADDPVASAYPTSADAVRYASPSMTADTVGNDDGWLTVKLGKHPAVPLVHSDAMVMLGTFQRENAMAAGAAALLLGGNPHSIGLALASAPPLPFRLQLLAVINGVQIYDNAVSTEIESTRSALEALRGRRIHWIGGGKSKDGNYQKVADGVAPHLASAHLFGAAADPLGACLLGRVPATRHGRIQAALDAAMLDAKPGEAVLFSPAFASFDQYMNFRARALEFHQWVATRRLGGTAPEKAADAFA